MPIWNFKLTINGFTIRIDFWIIIILSRMLSSTLRPQLTVYNSSGFRWHVWQIECPFLATLWFWIHVVYSNLWWYFYAKTSEAKGMKMAMFAFRGKVQTVREIYSIQKYFWSQYRFQRISAKTTQKEWFKNQQPIESRFSMELSLKMINLTWSNEQQWRPTGYQ